MLQSRGLPTSRCFKLLLLLLLIVCFSCEMSHKQSEFKLEAIPLSDFKASIDQASSADRHQCDTLTYQQYAVADEMMGVVITDATPVWKDISLKEVLDTLHFTDIVSITSTHKAGCSGVYHAVKLNSGLQGFVYQNSVSTFTRRQIDQSTIANTLLQWAMDNDDSLTIQRIGSFIQTKHSNDTLTYASYGEYDDHFVLLGHTAKFSLDHRLEHDHAKRFLKGKRILEDGALSDLRRIVIDDMIHSIDERCKNVAIRQSEIDEYLSLIKSVINTYDTVPETSDARQWVDLLATKTLLKHWQVFRKVSSDERLLTMLEHSKNDAVNALGTQMRSVLALEKNDFKNVRHVLIEAWRSNPDITRRYYDYVAQYALVPTAVSIDSILLNSHDYKKCLSFIDGLQGELTDGDSVFINFLQTKRYQLCIESDCPEKTFRRSLTEYYGLGSYDQFAQQVNVIESQQLARMKNTTKVLVPRGVRIKDGVHGKMIRTLVNDVEGDVLYVYHYNHAKIKSGNEVFWADKSHLQQVPKPMFTESESTQLINPFVKEIIDVPYADKYLLIDVNEDGINDLLDADKATFCIDGGSSRELWNSQNQRSIFLDGSLYEYSSHIRKKTLLNAPQWIFEPKLVSDYFISILMHDEFLFAFTRKGKLLKIDKEEGSLVDSYQFDGSISEFQISSDNGGMSFILYHQEKGLSSLYYIDWDDGDVTVPYTFNQADHVSIQLHDNEVYFNNGFFVRAMNVRTGQARVYEFKNQVERFEITDEGMLMVYADRQINAFDKGSIKPKWSKSGFNALPKRIDDSDLVYIVADHTLYAMSLKDGHVQSQLTLPIKVPYDVDLTLQFGRLLIPSYNGLIVIENQDY